MTYIERNTILQDDTFIARVRIAFCDWLNYWASNGTASIEDQDLRDKTDMLVGSAISNTEAFVKKIAVLVIAESSVKEAAEITDANVSSAVTSVMSHAIDYLL